MPVAARGWAHISKAAVFSVFIQTGKLLMVSGFASDAIVHFRTHAAETDDDHDGLVVADAARGLRRSFEPARRSYTLDIDKWAPGEHVLSLDAALERQIRVGAPVRHAGELTPTFPDTSEAGLRLPHADLR